MQGDCFITYAKHDGRWVTEREKGQEAARIQGSLPRKGLHPVLPMPAWEPGILQSAVALRRVWS